MATQQSLPAAINAVSSRHSRVVPAIKTQFRLLTVAMAAIDALAIGAALAVAYLIRFKTGIPLLETPPHSLGFYSSLAFWVVPVWLCLFLLYRLYDRRYLFSGSQEYGRVVNACTVGLVAVVAESFLDVTLSISRGWLLAVWVLSILFVGGSRFVLRRVLRRLRSAGFLSVSTVILGANTEGRALAEQFLGDPGSGIQIAGFIDSTLPRGTSVVGGLSILGDLQNAERITREWGISQIIVAATALSREELLDLFQRFGNGENVEIRLSSGLFEILTTGVQVQEVSCVPLMTPHRTRITGVDAVLKAALDYGGALAGLIALSPLLLILALMVKLDSPGPMLYRRRVRGQGGKTFDAFKFRTMVVNAESVLLSNQVLRNDFDASYKLKEDPRVTRVGRFLRRTSLDELPQLLNVLRGEMSLVGPRMISPEESPRYGKWQLNLLTVKPGITGPWQVRGRSDVPYEDRVRLSMHYIRNYSIWMDLEILLRTIPAVMRARGAY